MFPRGAKVEMKMIRTIGLTELPVASFRKRNESTLLRLSERRLDLYTMYGVVEYFKWARDVMWRCSFMIMMAILM